MMTGPDAMGRAIARMWDAPDRASAIAAAEVFVDGLRESFRYGVPGFVDDRIADGQGWVSFDASTVRCPVVVLHEEQDPIVPVARPSTAGLLLANAELKILAEFGHLSIATQVVGAVEDLLGSPSAGFSGHRREG